MGKGHLSSRHRLAAAISEGAPEPFGGAVIIIAKPPDAEGELEGVESEAEGEGVCGVDLAVERKAITVGYGGEDEGVDGLARFSNSRIF